MKHTVLIRYMTKPKVRAISHHATKADAIRFIEYAYMHTPCSEPVFFYVNGFAYGFTGGG